MCTRGLTLNCDEHDSCLSRFPRSLFSLSPSSSPYLHLSITLPCAHRTYLLGVLLLNLAGCNHRSKTPNHPLKDCITATVAHDACCVTHRYHLPGQRSVRAVNALDPSTMLKSISTPACGPGAWGPGWGKNQACQVRRKPLASSSCRLWPRQLQLE